MTSHNIMFTCIYWLCIAGRLYDQSMNGLTPVNSNGEPRLYVFMVGSSVYIILNEVERQPSQAVNFCQLFLVEFVRLRIQCGNNA